MQLGENRNLKGYLISTTANHIPAAKIKGN
jgi:hypothetical protein